MKTFTRKYLYNMSYKQLISLCKTLKIKNYSSINKDVLTDLLYVFIKEKEYKENTPLDQIIWHLFSTDYGKVFCYACNNIISKANYIITTSYPNIIKDKTNLMDYILICIKCSQENTQLIPYEYFKFIKIKNKISKNIKLYYFELYYFNKRCYINVHDFSYLLERDFYTITYYIEGKNMEDDYLFKNKFKEDSNLFVVYKLKNLGFVSCAISIGNNQIANIGLFTLKNLYDLSIRDGKIEYFIRYCEVQEYYNNYLKS